jgi:hypothetical protein
MLQRTGNEGERGSYWAYLEGVVNFNVWSFYLIHSGTYDCQKNFTKIFAKIFKNILAH